MLTPAIKQRLAAAYLKRILDNILPDHSDIQEMALENESVSLSENECRDVAARILYLSEVAFKLVKNKRK